MHTNQFDDDSITTFSIFFQKYFSDNSSPSIWVSNFVCLSQCYCTLSMLFFVVRCCYLSATQQIVMSSMKNSFCQNPNSSDSSCGAYTFLRKTCLVVSIVVFTVVSTYTILYQCSKIYYIQIRPACRVSNNPEILFASEYEIWRTRTKSVCSTN